MKACFGMWSESTEREKALTEEELSGFLQIDFEWGIGILISSPSNTDTQQQHHQ